MTPSRRTSTKRLHTAAPGEDNNPSALPRLLQLLGLICVLVVVVFLAFRPVHDPDTWFHLELGDYILKQGTLPRTDPFSFTAGDTPYVPSGWLTSVLMAASDRIYPESSLGPILMATLVAAGAALLVMWRAWRSGAIVVGTISLLIGLGLAATRLSPRPDTWSILGLTALLFILTQPWASQRTPRIAAPPPLKLLWCLPVLIAVWANLHAGVLIALPFLGTYAIWLVARGLKSQEKSWYMAAVPVTVACVAWVLNPYGLGLLGLARRIALMPRVEWVIEWMPLFKADFPMPWTAYLTLLALAGLTVWIMRKHWREFHGLEILWIAALFALALMQRRHVGLAGLGIPMLLARGFFVKQSFTPHTRNRMATLGVGGLTVVLAFFQYTGANGNGSGLPRFGRNCAALPCFTADFLAQTKPPANMFNSYNLGGYLLNVLWPDARVYIDGRLDTYPPDVWLDMLALEENTLDVDTFAARYGIKTFVVVTEGAFGVAESLPARLSVHPNYALVYMDDKAAVFVHREPETEAYLADYGYSALDPWDLRHQTELLASPATGPQVIREIDRMLLESPGSAAVHALAGFIAWATDDHEMAQLQLDTARQINEDNELLGRVDERLGKAEALLHQKAGQSP